MSEFSIKAVSQATGLTVETLRAWERRYGAVSPQRDSAGRRNYSTSDVTRLRLLRSATELGHPISRATRLTPDELAKLVSDAGGQALATARGHSYVERALDAAEHSDPNGVEEVLISALSILPPNEAAHTVIAPLLREVGERWHRDQLSIAQEHMVTDIVRRLVTSASRGYLRSDNTPCLIMATLSGERHELGILMCSWLASARRYRTHYLGADLPAEQIARFAVDVEAKAVLVSMVMPENQVPVLQQLNALASLLQRRAEIWLGGGAASQLRAADIPVGCVMLPSLTDFEQRLDLIVE